MGTRARAIATATLGADDLRAWTDALGRLGYDVDALLAAAGIRRADMARPDARIPCAAVGAVFELAARQRPTKNLGVRTAAVTPIGAFPLIDYAVATCENVAQGLRQLARYYRLTGAPYTLQLQFDHAPIHAVLDGPAGAFGFEFGVALTLLHLRDETGGQFRAEFVSFMHTPDDALEIERLLGCPVRANESWNGWAMSREVLDLALRRREPALRGVLERQADDMMARLPACDGAQFEVRRALISRVAGGDMRIQVVARALATSARSLQRQLSAEGCSYQELVDATRKEAAERYLAGSVLPIGEVAYLLGYSEPAAFHRAFKRWTGATPQGFRDAQRGSVPHPASEQPAGSTTRRR